MKNIKNIQEYKQLVQTDKPILLDFYAEWCGPCKSLMPTVEKLAEEYKEDFVIAKVNVDHNPELAQMFKVRSIPALFFLQDGKITESLIGLQTEATLKNKIKGYLVGA